VLPSSKLINEKEEYKVEEILRKQHRKGELWYKVKWIDYSLRYDQWISEQDLDDTSELHEMYNVRVKKRHQRWNTAKERWEAVFSSYRAIAPKSTLKTWKNNCQLNQRKVSVKCKQSTFYNEADLLSSFSSQTQQMQWQHALKQKDCSEKCQ
jgi:hypothetical protein